MVLPSRYVTSWASSPVKFNTVVSRGLHLPQGEHGFPEVTDVAEPER